MTESRRPLLQHRVNFKMTKVKTTCNNHNRSPFLRQGLSPLLRVSSASQSSSLASAVACCNIAVLFVLLVVGVLPFNNNKHSFTTLSTTSTSSFQNPASTTSWTTVPVVDAFQPGTTSITATTSHDHKRQQKNHHTHRRRLIHIQPSWLGLDRLTSLSVSSSASRTTTSSISSNRSYGNIIRPSASVVTSTSTTCTVLRMVGSSHHQNDTPSQSTSSSSSSQPTVPVDTSSSGRDVGGGGGGQGTSSSLPSSSSSSFIPSNEASTTTEFLAGLWELIAQGNSMVKGESKTVLFPNMESRFKSDPQYLNLITAHLDTCKDVCDYFGILTTVQPYFGFDDDDDGMGGDGSVGKRPTLKGFTVKSFRSPDHDPDKFEFEYDPFWDDGDDWDYEGIDDEYEEEEELEASTESSVVDSSSSAAARKTVKYPDIVNKIPDDDDEIITKSKNWVAKICSDMGICPFTSGSDQAGLPIGPVYYTIDRSTSMEDMYACYWKEVVRVEQQPESDLSTTLLVAPEFCIDNVEIFESFSTTLTQPLSALGIEDAVQLVFFHPHWSFRDGGDRGIGEGMAANYARRSPWPMINILRTNQVRAAQKGIPTGLVYKQNEKTLSSVGVEKLETMLRLRDWSDIADVKVNRREMEALRVAQDFQKTGVIKNNDKSFANDATPAANKVDETQVEQGDLVNVIIEALEKRLGRPSVSSKSATAITRLSGPETSATIMASDFLLAELRRICEKNDNSETKNTDEKGEVVTTNRSETQQSIQQDVKQPLQSQPSTASNERKTRFDITALNNEGEQSSSNTFL